MKKIKHARFLRSIESEGVTTAEVEFAWENDFGADATDNRYVAYLEKQGDNAYDVAKIVKNDSELALDWYDNPEHQAYKDVTSEVLAEGDSTPPAKVDRASFVQEMLDYEGVRDDMAARRKP